MNDHFYLHFRAMPKGTAQQKGYNRKTGRYFKKTKLSNAEQEFKLALLPYKPTKPSDKPIILKVDFFFDTKDKSKWGSPNLDIWIPKATRPDTDNYLKLFKDCMTEMGFWLDDSQVYDEHVRKFYAKDATIRVYWEEIDVKPMLDAIKAVDKANKKARKEGV